MSKPKEDVSFIQNHEPALKSGEYQITVKQEADLVGPGGASLSASETKYICVAGERFSIDTKNIFSQFPPPSKTGSFSNVLPHITLTRSTLPWERESISGNTNMPWMWLMVYDENDIKSGRVKLAKNQKLDTVFDINNNSSVLINEDIDLEPGEQNSDAVSVVQVEQTFLEKIFPTNDELPLMSFVRENEIEGVDTEHAICMANRMPSKGVQSFACLVSLEDRLVASGGTTISPNFSGKINSGDCSFVVLAEWSFSCLDNNNYQITAKGLHALNELVKPSATNAASYSSAFNALKEASLPELYTDLTSFTSAISGIIGNTAWTALSTAIQNNILNCFEVPDETFKGFMKNLSSGAFSMDELSTVYQITPGGLTKLKANSSTIGATLVDAVSSLYLQHSFPSSSAFSGALNTALGSYWSTLNSAEQTNITNCFSSSTYQVSTASIAQLKAISALPSAIATDITIANFPTVYDSSASFISALSAKLKTAWTSLTTPVQTQIVACFTITTYQVTTTGVAAMKALPTAPSSIITTAITVANFPDLYTNLENFQYALSNKIGTYWSQTPTATRAIVMQCFTPGSAQIDATNRYLSKGSVPFPHYLSTGGKSVSWYRGPFQPAITESTLEKNFPALKSDDLLRFDSILNMLDVSYAAAWELGRALTLNNKSVSMDLYSWRRQQKWAANQNASTYLQNHQAKGLRATISKEKKSIQDWCTSLLNLSAVPFNYLVPDERLLPNESIRFFTLDNDWLSSLMDGALSIGRVNQSESNNDQAVLAAFSVPVSTVYSGFLVRSEVVSGWPGIETKVTDSSENVLTLVSKNDLGPNLVLYIYEGQVDSAKFHLKPEALHFGFDVAYNTTDYPDFPTFTKENRFQFGAQNATSGITDVTPTSAGSIQKVPIAWRDLNASTLASSGQLPPYKVVDMTQMSANLQTDNTLSITFTAAQFALLMIEGVTEVIFSNSGTETGTGITIDPIQQDASSEDMNLGNFVGDVPAQVAPTQSQSLSDNETQEDLVKPSSNVWKWIVGAMLVVGASAFVYFKYLKK